MTRRRLWTEDESGVSAVIGAVLVFGLMASAFIMWSFTTLPVWMADNEEARNQEVEDGFRGLTSGLELLIADGSPGPISRSIPLSADEVPLLQPAPSLGRLYFESGFGWHGTFNGSTSHIAGGVVDGDPSEIIDGDVLSDVVRLDALTLSLTATGIKGGNEASITVMADDGNDTVTGTLALRGLTAPGNSCGDTELVFVVSSTLLSTDRTTTECGFGASLTDYQVDALDADFGFFSQARRLAEGYTITLTDDNADGAFGAAWTDSGGRTQVIGAGTVVGDLTRDEVGGRVVFDPVDLAYLDQTLVWEGGAIIRQQAEGGVISLASELDIQTDGSTGYLRWTLLDLEGTGNVGGSGTANIALTSNGADSQLLTCTDGVITIDSPYAQAWANHLRTEILVAGAGSSTSLTSSDDQVTLSLTNGGGVTEWRVLYQVQAASVVVS